MVRLTRKQLILAKSESSYGVDASPDATSNAVKARVAVPTNPDIQQIVSQNATTTFSPQLARVGRILNKTTLEFEFTTHGKAGDGDSATPLRLDPFFQAAGLIPEYTPETSAGANDGYILYKPSTLNPVSLTLYAYKDGVLYKYLGAYNNLTFSFTPGELCIMSAEVVGIYSTPTDSTEPAATYDEVLPPICENMSLQIGSFTPVVRSAELNLNIEIPERLDLNSEQGLKGLMIAGREPRLSITLEAVKEAEKAFWTELEAGTVNNIQFQLQSTEAGTILFNMPKAQILNISHGDDNGILTYELDCILTKDTDAGDDELTIKFSA